MPSFAPRLSFDRLLSRRLWGWPLPLRFMLGLMLALGCWAASWPPTATVTALADEPVPAFAAPAALSADPVQPPAGPPQSLAGPTQPIAGAIAPPSSGLPNLLQASDLISFSRDLGDGVQAITIINASRRWMAVYHVDSGGQIRLTSSRPLDEDFTILFNATSPLPQEIRRLQGK